MPAPNRRAVGASLAQNVSGRHHPTALDGRAQVVSSRGRAARRWEADQRPAPPPPDPPRLERVDRSAWQYVLNLPCGRHGAGPAVADRWPRGRRFLPAAQMVLHVAAVRSKELHEIVARHEAKSRLEPARQPACIGKGQPQVLIDRAGQIGRRVEIPHLPRSLLARAREDQHVVIPKDRLLAAPLRPLPPAPGQ